MSESAPAPQVAEAPAQYGVVPQGQVLVDSGPLLALFNGADHWHARVVAWLQAHPALALVSTWPVLTEVCALLARRVHNQAALDFLLWVERGALQVDAQVGDFEQGHGLSSAAGWPAACRARRGRRRSPRRC